MPFDPLAESLASQSQSAASLQRPKITATEYDALLACTLDMLERRLGREVTIEQAKKVMTELNLNDQDSIAASEKLQDMVVEKGPRIAITSDRRAQMREGMNQSRNGGYPTMDGQQFPPFPKPFSSEAANESARERHYEPQAGANPMWASASGSPPTPIVSCTTNLGTVNTHITNSFNNHAVRISSDETKKTRRSTTNGSPK